MTDTKYSTEPDPRAIDLAAHLLGMNNFTITEVSMFTWMAKAHFGKTDDGQHFRLILGGHGAWELTFKDLGGAYMKSMTSGHIEETPAGVAARAAAVELGRKLTGHKVEVSGWMDFAGIAVGRHLKPTGDDDAHSFILLELSEDQYAIVKGDNPNPAFTDVLPEFEQKPFSQGMVSRFNTSRVSISSSINIIDQDAFCAAMGIERLNELTGDILARKMTTLAADAKCTGLSGLGCTDPVQENGFLKYDVHADVSDFGLLVSKARDRYEDCWGDDNWYPASPEDALYEVALASNANPSPDIMGFEFVSLNPVTDITGNLVVPTEEPKL